MPALLEPPTDRDPPLRHLGWALRQWRLDQGLAPEQVAGRLGYKEPSVVLKVERGVYPARPDQFLKRWATVFGPLGDHPGVHHAWRQVRAEASGRQPPPPTAISPHTDLGLNPPTSDTGHDDHVTWRPITATTSPHQPIAYTSRDQVEQVRLGLNEALGQGAMAEASLDDWEQTVLRYGRATRDRPAGVLLHDLSTDLAELKRTVERYRSASALRRLTRVAAHMSGLMCLTFCKVDDRPAFRRWARTARLAADEAGDPRTSSWTLAQEAYGHYYSGDLLEAIDVAQRAQAVVATTPCVGAALAAALEARAYAAMGRDQQTRRTLGHAEGVLSHLDGDALTPSAFGYTEAQLRFHEGSAYTHLGNAQAAFAAQDRALELCAPGDFTDWAMTRLDRARCLAAVGDTADAVDYAAETLTALSEPQRRGIITLRGHEMLSALPKDQQALPAACDLHELLMLTTEPKGVRDP